MAITYDALATITLTSNTNSIEFTSISTSHTDLIIVMNGMAHFTSQTFVGIAMRFNGDSGSNYSVQNMFSTNYSTARGSQGTSQTYIQCYLGADATVNQKFNANKIEINNYRSTSQWKSCLTRNAALAQDSDKDRALFLIGGTWRSTAAITSISFTNVDSTSGVFSGTTFSLYGIKRA